MENLFRETSLHETRQGTLVHSHLISLSHYGLIHGLKSRLGAHELHFIKKKKKAQAGNKSSNFALDPRLREKVTTTSTGQQAFVYCFGKGGGWRGGGVGERHICRKFRQSCCVLWKGPKLLCVLKANGEKAIRPVCETGREIITEMPRLSCVTISD